MLAHFLRRTPCALPFPFPKLPEFSSIMFYRPGLTLATLLLTLSCCSAVRLQESPEAVTAGAIAAWTRMYADKNDGKPPTTWPEYKDFLKMSLNDVLVPTVPSRRYGVMDPPVPLLPPLSGVMLVVNRSPIQDTQIPPGFLGLSHVLKEPGRYVIYRDSAGEYTGRGQALRHQHAGRGRGAGTDGARVWRAVSGIRLQPDSDHSDALRSQSDRRDSHRRLP